RRLSRERYRPPARRRGARGLPADEGRDIRDIARSFGGEGEERNALSIVSGGSSRVGVLGFGPRAGLRRAGEYAGAYPARRRVAEETGRASGAGRGAEARRGADAFGDRAGRPHHRVRVVRPVLLDDARRSGRTARP